MSWQEDLKKMVQEIVDLQKSMVADDPLAEAAKKAKEAMGPFEAAMSSSRQMADYAKQWEDAISGYANMWDAMSEMPNSPTTEMIRLGTDVHYVSYGSADGRYPKKCRAAKVVEYDDSTYTLMVFNPSGIHFVQAGYDEDGNESGAFHLVCDW